MLEITYSVKFRAFGLTFATVSGVREVPLPSGVGTFVGPRELFRLDDRGVLILGRVK